MLPAIVFAVTALSWEKKIDHTTLDKHVGGDNGKVGTPDCHSYFMPKQWWQLVTEAGVQHGTKEHLLLELGAWNDLWKQSDGEKWPNQWKENWGDMSKGCNWPESGMQGAWKGLICHSNVYWPPPPAGTGRHISSAMLAHGLFQGKLPENFKYLVAMYEFEIPHSRITGPLPDFGLWMATQRFDLSHNEITGTLPDDFLPAPCLATLNLDNNQIEGTIPKSLRSRTVMLSLRLSNNKFTGSIPDFGDMPELRELDLSGNQLSGTLPDSLLKLPKLRWLKLHQNHFSGPVPPGIGDLQHLSVVSVRGNDAMDKAIPDSLGLLPLRVFNGTDGMQCSRPDLLRHVPESTSCGGRPLGSSKGTWTSTS